MPRSTSILADNGSFYELGFYPEPMIRDGKFHTLKVTVNRPGLTVRARPGYWADAPAGAGPTPPAALLDAASGAGLSTFGVPLRAFAAPLAPTSAGVMTALTADISYPTAATGAALDDQITLRILALDPDGKIKTSVDRTLAFTATGRGGAAPSVAIDQAVDVPKSAATLRVVVVSRALGRAGSVDLAFEPPQFSDDRLQLTAPVLGLDGAPPAPALEAGTIAALVPFQPTTTRAFAASDTLRIFAHVLWSGKDPKDAQAAVTLSVTGAAQPPVAVAVTAPVDATGRHAGSLDARLPLAGLSPGRYTLVVGAQLGKQRAARDVAFEIRN